MRFLTPVLLSFLATLHAAAQPGRPPAAMVQNVTDRYFGTTVIDPYRWMEQPGPAFDTFLKKQATYTDSALAKLPLRAALLARLNELDKGAAAPAGGVQLLPGEVYLYLKAPAGSQTPKLYRRQGISGAETLLIDPDRFKTATEQYSISYFVPSPDNSRIAYAIAANGSEKPTLHILDVATGKDLSETIPRMDWEYARPEWHPDGRSFFYTQMRAWPAGAPVTDLQKNKQVRLHILGTDPARDQLILEAGKAGRVALDAADTPILLTLTHTPSPFVLALVKHGDAGEVSLYRAPLASIGQPNTPWVKICGRADEVRSFVAHEDDLYLLTSKGASRFKIVRTSLAKPNLATTETVVPPGPALLDAMSPAADGLYVSEVRGGLDETWRIAWKGKPVPERILAPNAPACFVAGTNHLLPGALIASTAWTGNGLAYRYNPATKQFTDTGLLPKHPLEEAAGLESREVQVPSHDGTLVPLSIVYKRGLVLNGQNPTLLTGYGAYGKIQYPYFDPEALAWFEQGGVFAVAHVRGGGELGEEWHKAGQKLTKPNTWKDFIACAEYLVKEKYTSPAHLAGEGTSAGGVLIGRAITERPDLFGAAVINVGMLDALRFETTANGVPNIQEFGTTTDSAGFRGLRQMSAFHHVQQGTRYPAVLLTTGTNDRRVEAWQTAKMAARLQAATNSSKPVLLRVDYSAGHGAGASRQQRNEKQADTYAFLLEWLK
ncbi:prolyl oligopeptidase family serine peptidase [Hymenobacter norwichensis]|uniref:prolyl oligopeptidase family serine peptidase n=1 Tax=Hymenobacter norwichensis TaxID=223903 RepID=UPI00040766FF|nr:prolyl oligopeptidase family serine peptidase [Hymenobacter norwichensis]